MRPAVGTPCDSVSPSPGGSKSGHGHCALRGRVQRRRALQLGQEQRPAHQRGRVAERRDRDVDARAGLDAGRKIGGDDDRRDIAVAQRDAVHVNADASSIACTACSVNGVLRNVSPVPCRPTTRP